MSHTEFDFPANPAIGDTVVPPNGYTYEWDGVKWHIVPTPGSGGGGGPGETFVNSFNTRFGDVTLSQGDVVAAGGAPITSPAFGGTPLAPTAPSGTVTRQIATTEFVSLAVGSGAGGTGGGIPDAPNDGPTYGRGGAPAPAWVRVIAATNDIVDGGSF